MAGPSTPLEMHNMVCLSTCIVVPSWRLSKRLSHQVLRHHFSLRKRWHFWDLYVRCSYCVRLSMLWQSQWIFSRCLTPLCTSCSSNTWLSFDTSLHRPGSPSPNTDMMIGLQKMPLCNRLCSCDYSQNIWLTWCVLLKSSTYFIEARMRTSLRAFSFSLSDSLPILTYTRKEWVFRCTKVTYLFESIDLSIT